MAAATPFRGEKDTNYEGGWRVPCAIRWPGMIKPGTTSNEIFSHTDMLPTLAAAAGEPDIVGKLKKGYKAGSKTFKVQIDGYNLLPFLKGEVKENPRKAFLYWSDDGDLMALRYEQWKVTSWSSAPTAWMSGGAVVALRCTPPPQSAERPLRKGPGGCVHVLRQVDGGSMFLLVPRPGDRRPVPEDLQRVSAAPETLELQH